MYKALYRKYRPNTFDDIYGQSIIVQILKNAIINNKTTHAYLFSGPRGTGKTSIAKIFAKTLNCENLNEYKPCDKCVSCTQINNKQDTDIVEIDAASNNGVDEIREIKNKVNLVPSSSKYKIYIIDEVHMLTIGAFNALLKTLEEPPKHVIFILATTEPHKIPATILSRCQRFDFKKISEEKIIECLEKIIKNEEIDIEKEAISEIARVCDGGLRDAINILDQSLSYCVDKIKLDDIHQINGTVTQKELETLILNLLNKNIEEIFKKIDEYEKKGKDLTKLTEEIILYLKNLLLLNEVPNYVKNLNNKEIYENFKGKIILSEIFNYIIELNETIQNMRFSNNPNLVLQLTLLKIIGLKEQKKETKSSLLSDVEKPKPVVEDNKKPEETKKDLVTELEEIKKIRINNTLAEFDKKSLLEIRKKSEEIRKLVVDNKYREKALLILDGELKAASPNNLIFVFASKKKSDLFNEDLLDIEKTIKKGLNKSYKVISVNTDEWNIIKNEFNSKKKEYKLLEETFDLKKIIESFKKNNDYLKEIFGDIIEYS